MGELLTSPEVLGTWLAARGLGAAGARMSWDDLAVVVALRAGLRDALGGGPGVGAALAAFPLRLVPDADGGLRLGADAPVPAVNPIVERVAGAVASGGWDRMKLCAAPDCRWAFHDGSRNGGSRWCSMAVCGNRYKTRAYRQRLRADGRS
ncbi:CGNR zinc finger domain-containing protein [Actinoplanes sp. NPDC051494]|uniref:CGNR zinc finger domain-containing protein n=1 Tax=Actinoplanes sp. NPDC051494 TaxID=3363907 RepID=UPI00379D759B